MFMLFPDEGYEVLFEPKTGRWESVARAEYWPARWTAATAS